MVINTNQLKDICSKILNTLDTNNLSTVTDALEIKISDNTLNINITNKEYYVRFKFPVTENIDFHAVVNASLFLKLINQITESEIELNIVDNSLQIKGNGIYTLPFIYEDTELLKLEEIKINNITSQFTVSTEILKSILTYNSKELNRGVMTRPIQKLYYIDNKGAITFTSGACVNSFILPEPVKLLLNNRIIKLFNIFNSENVNVVLGKDTLNDFIQSKIIIYNDSVSLSAIINDDESLFNSVPVEAIRGRANDNYPYSIFINKKEFSQALSRISLFCNSDNPYCTFTFNNNSLIMTTPKSKNEEQIYYTENSNSVSENEEYLCILDIEDLKTLLNGINQTEINIRFGNCQAIVIAYDSVKNVVPECVLEDHEK